MTEAQKRLRELQDRQSKERGKMAELAKVDSLTDEQRAELDKIETGTPDLERQIRAARVAVEDEEKAAQTKALDTPDAEMRERIELRSKASLGKFLTAALSGRQVDGPEAELRSAAGITDGIPLELWDTPVEQRDDVVTDAPDTVGINLAPIQPAIFAASIAPILGIEMPRVESGTYASATISTSLTAAAKAKGDAQDSTEAMFTTTTATPKRISGRLSISVEDVAAVGANNFESALRENVALVMADQLDNQAINGDGQAPNLTGLFNRLGDPPAVPNAVADFDAFAAAHADSVDGLFANTIKDVALIVGPATYTLASKVFQSAANFKGELSAAAYAMANTGAFFTNKRMPDAPSEGARDNVQEAIAYRMGRPIRTAVCPHWNMISIDDIYSGSASGERHFTMHVLLGDVIVTQPGAYRRVAFKLA